MKQVYFCFDKQIASGIRIVMKDKDAAYLHKQFFVDEWPILSAEAASGAVHYVKSNTLVSISTYDFKESENE